MKKEFIFFAVSFLLCLSLASAAFNLEIDKNSRGDVVIAELKNPAIFDFVINNKGGSDHAEIYSLVSVSMSPKGTFLIPTGESAIEVRAYLGDYYLENPGFYSFQYQIKGQDQGIFEDKLFVQVASLQDVFSIETMKIHPDEDEAILIIKNNVNSYLENVEIEFNSEFFNIIRKMDFEPYESVEIPIALADKNPKLKAGQYDINAKIKVQDSSVKLSGVISYLENEGTSVTKESSGLLVVKSLVKEVNEGNIPVTARVGMRKNIVSRLFTGYSIAPLEATRSGLVVDYKWEQNLEPGESFSVVSTTNYTFIVLFLALIVLTAVGMRFYTFSPLNIDKSVSFVKTKGGEFALKVRINAKAGRAVSNVQIIDRLPPMAKLYGVSSKPDRIDEASKRLSWDISRLSKGEERVFSYIIYSHVRAVGRFELPAAMAIFDSNGKRANALSNKAYFVSETLQESHD